MRSFAAWVYRIARNLIIDQGRRRQRWGEVTLNVSSTEAGASGEIVGQLVDPTYEPESRLMARQIGENYLRAVQSLPATYRTTLFLLEKEHSYGQIATMMRCPVGTVRSRVHRARILLRRELEAEEPR